MGNRKKNYFKKKRNYQFLEENRFKIDLKKNCDEKKIDSLKINFTPTNKISNKKEPFKKSYYFMVFNRSMEVM